MKIIIKATNLKLTVALKQYIEKKIRPLQRFLKKTEKDIAEADVEVGKPSQHHKSGAIYYAEINLNVLGKLYRAKTKTADIYAAIDEIKDEVQREIKRFKEKQITKNRRRERSFKKKKALSPYARFRKK